MFPCSQAMPRKKEFAVSSSPLSSLSSKIEPDLCVIANAVNTSCPWIPSNKIDTGINHLLQLVQNGTGTVDAGPAYVDDAPTSSSSVASSSSIPTSTSGSTTTPTNSAASTPMESVQGGSTSSSSLSGGAIAGIVIGAVAALALAAIAFLLWRRKNESRKPAGTQNGASEWTKAELSGDQATSSNIGKSGELVDSVNGPWNKVGGNPRYELDVSHSYELPGTTSK
jgi:hypothetical protein